MHGNAQSDQIQRLINAANTQLDEFLSRTKPARVDIGEYIVENTGNFYQLKFNGTVIRTSGRLEEIRETLAHRIREDFNGRLLPLAEGTFQNETRQTHPELVTGNTRAAEFAADNKL